MAAALAIRSASSIPRSRRSGPTTRRPAHHPRRKRSPRRDGPAGGNGNAPQGGPRVVLYGFIAFIAVVALAFAGVLLLR